MVKIGFWFTDFTNSGLKRGGFGFVFREEEEAEFGAIQGGGGSRAERRSGGV